MSSTQETLKDSGYTFNQTDKKYVFHTESLVGRNYVLDESKVDTILKLYSNFDKSPFTAGEIAQRTSTPKKVIEYIIRKLGINHSSIPYTDEKIKESEPESLVSDLLLEKRANIEQKFERRDWKQTIADAENWRLFQHAKKDPFEEYLNKWTPPELTARYNTISDLKDDKSDSVFVIALSDLHFGAAANSRYMFNKPSWTTQDTVNAVDKFADEIIKEVNSRNYKFKKGVILGLGDLIHSMLGKTARGTELKYDVIREEQFDYALNSLMVFISRMIELFGNVECHDVGGNHHYELDMALFRALGLYFKKDDRATFTHYSTRPAAFRIDNTLIMMDHGADSVERVYVPNGSKIERHVHNILLNNLHLLEGVKTRLFLQGDKHHFEHLEFSSFEYIMFGTILGADEHAATNNWHNRPRQSCLVLNENGLREVLHVYFDQ